MPLDLLDEHCVEVGLVDGQPRLHDERVHLLEDGAEVRLLEEVGHLARAEHVVDVLEEDLVGDLVQGRYRGDIGEITLAIWVGSELGVGLGVELGLGLGLGVGVGLGVG